MKFKSGDRVSSFGGTTNCHIAGRLGTVKRIAAGFATREMYVVEWDDGGGWGDPISLGKGWNIEVCELQLLSEIEPFEVDE